MAALKNVKSCSIQSNSHEDEEDGFDDVEDGVIEFCKIFSEIIDEITDPVHDGVCEGVHSESLQGIVRRREMEMMKRLCCRNR